MNEWDSYESADQCQGCGRRLEGPLGERLGPMVGYYCYRCRTGEQPEQRKPNCLRCHEPIEKGPLCDGCEAAIEAKREQILRKALDRWPAILDGMRERL